MSNGHPHSHLIARSGIFTGLHPGMGLAAKGMVVAFVLFTVLNVDFAGGVYGAVRGWIESALNWYYISAMTVIFAICP